MAEPTDHPPLAFGTAVWAELERRVADGRTPPVAHWNPPYCGDSEMRIDRDGGWHHQGRPIRRPAMVRLFASILRREADGSHVLVTPVEKLGIAVDDAPFVAVELRAQGTGATRRLAFRLNTDAVVIAGPMHPLTMRTDGTTGADGPRPYLHVRGPIGNGLDARIARGVFYELAELAIADGTAPWIWSGGARFDLGGDA